MQNTKLSTKQARGERNERTAGSAGPDIGAAPDRVRGRGEGLRIGVRPGGGGAAGGCTPPTRRRSTGHSIQEFEARTGIWVEVEAGGTSELLAACAGRRTPRQRM